MLELAKQTLIDGDFSCVVVKDGKVLHTCHGTGISPILELYRNHPEDMLGASVADKIIGRAAAVVYVLCGIKEIYCHVISEPGVAYLAQHGISHSCHRTVERIDNRTKTDMCPMEKASFASDDPQEAYASITAFIDSQKNK